MQGFRFVKNCFRKLSDLSGIIKASNETALKYIRKGGSAA
jgi:hypothetical protein